MSNFTAMSANKIATEWTLVEGAQSIFFAIVFPFTSLVLMSFPQTFDRWVAVTVVLLSAYAAFVTSDHFSPDDTLNEVYTRYILIGGSYMLSMAYKIDPKKNVQPHVSNAIYSKCHKALIGGIVSIQNRETELESMVQRLQAHVEYSRRRIILGESISLARRKAHLGRTGIR